MHVGTSAKPAKPSQNHTSVGMLLQLSQAKQPSTLMLPITCYLHCTLNGGLECSPSGSQAKLAKPSPANTSKCQACHMFFPAAPLKQNAVVCVKCATKQSMPPADGHPWPLPYHSYALLPKLLQAMSWAAPKLKLKPSLDAHMHSTALRWLICRALSACGAGHWDWNWAPGPCRPATALLPFLVQ